MTEHGSTIQLAIAEMMEATTPIAARMMKLVRSFLNSFGSSGSGGGIHLVSSVIVIYLLAARPVGAMSS